MVLLLSTQSLPSLQPSFHLPQISNSESELGPVSVSPKQPLLFVSDRTLAEEGGTVSSQIRFGKCRRKRFSQTPFPFRRVRGAPSGSNTYPLSQGGIPVGSCSQLTDEISAFGSRPLGSNCRGLPRAPTSRPGNPTMKKWDFGNSHCNGHPGGC